MLNLQSVTAGYGDTVVLRNVNFTVGTGQVAALLGPNGAGKTTLLRTATGLIKPRSGRVEISGRDLAGRPAHAYARAGVCHLPEGRGIFPSLTVRENLTIQARGRSLDDALAIATESFPVLGGRLGQVAGSLSGGEQQMLALARAYLSEPRLILVDEPSLGLAPKIVDHIYDALQGLVKRGLSVVLVEQYVQKALHLADTVFILNRGEIIYRGKAKEISTNEIHERYLGIEAAS